MTHGVYRVTGFAITGSYTMRVEFDDGTAQVIDFRPVLHGTLFGPLQDEEVFGQVAIDPEVHTLVWPNGADFDPETLHDWPGQADAMEQLAARWAKTESRVA